MTSNLSEAPAHMKRNVFLLSACLALSMTGASLVMVVVALTGKMLLPDGIWWTLPLTLQFVGTMCAVIPANLLMRKYGRRIGFTLGQVIGIIAAFICYYAIMQDSFELFCVGGYFLGFHNAFWGYYRFAAAETASHDFKSRAISFVMAGGVVAAIFGPELAKLTRELFAPILFAGSYVAIAGLCVAAIILIQFIRIPGLSEEEKANTGRPLREIMKQPIFIVAVLSAMVGYGMMSLVMTATPLAMQICGFEFDDSAFVIQWHALGMFAPSFFTGYLIRRFGVLRIILTGAVSNLLCVAINLSGVEFIQFFSSLVLLGIGWNFMFIGGTTLLTECYEPAERNKVQSLNDFLVFGTVSISSLSAGLLQRLIGWDAVNLAVIIPILIVVFSVIWLTRMTRRTQPVG